MYTLHNLKLSHVLNIVMYITGVALHIKSVCVSNIETEFFILDRLNAVL